MNIYSQVGANIRKTWFLILFFLVLIIGLGYLFSYIYSQPYFLYFAVILSALMSFISYWYSDKIVLSISHAKPVKKEDNPELYRLVENLSITAGLPMPRLYIMETSALNAFATGRDKNHGVIAVTRGLIEKLNKSEMEGVLSHELSHIGNRDILLSSVIVVLVGIIAIASDFFIRWSMFGGLRRRDNRGQLSALIAVLALVSAILAPIAAGLIQLAISRKREFLADASGALLTRYPEGLASALEKISVDHVPMVHAHNATAHLFFKNPFKNKQGSNWITKLFMTHPPIEERIAALRRTKI